MALMAWVVAGVQAICARDISINDQREARIHLCAGLTWGFLIMSAFTLICWLFHYSLITVLGATDEYTHLRVASTDALLVGSLAGPFFCILMILLTNLIFNQKRKHAIVLGILSIAIQIVTTAVVSNLFPSMVGIRSIEIRTSELYDESSSLLSSDADHGIQYRPKRCLVCTASIRDLAALL